MSGGAGSATSQVAFFAARELGFRYPGAATRAIDGVSLEVPAGSFHAVIGPNGSGKSTLGRLLLGALRPDSGAALMRGRPLRDWPRRELALEVGVVPQQEQHAFPVTVVEVVEMGRYPHLGAWRAESAADRRVVEDAMGRCDVVELAGRTTSTLSGGERQRVLIARALAQEPRALLLDEPTASLDVRHEMAIFELLRSLARDGVTVLLVTHNLNLAARYADRLTLLHRGRLVATGGAADVLQAGRLRDVYGWPVAIRPHPGPGPDTGVPQVVPLAAVQQ